MNINRYTFKIVTNEEFSNIVGSNTYVCLILY